MGFIADLINFRRVKSIVPITSHDFKIWEDESGNLLFRFRWDYDGKGYLKYNNFADEEELKKKVKEFQEGYMNALNSGGIAGLDNTMDFKEISQTAPQIPVIQSQFLRDNIYRYYNTNDANGASETKSSLQQTACSTPHLTRE